MWIPSHVNISGNLVADRLAISCLSNPTAKKFSNFLTAPEQISILKAIFKTDLIQSLHSRAPNLNLISRKNLGMDPWLVAREKSTTKILHRLRRNCNIKWLSRFDKDIEPLCALGCPIVEDTEHVIIDCPSYTQSRAPLVALFSCNNLPLDLFSVLGLNTLIPSNLQFKIRDKLIGFLHSSGLSHRI